MESLGWRICPSDPYSRIYTEGPLNTPSFPLIKLESQSAFETAAVDARMPKAGMPVAAAARHGQRAHTVDHVHRLLKRHS